MTKTPIVLFALCTSAGLALVTFAGPGAWGLGGLLGTGETLYVQVVGSDDLGVLAGLVTKERRGPMGLGATATTTFHSEGWIVVVPEGQSPPGDGPLVVTDELAFTDPNGATWLGREVQYGDLYAWVVPVGPVLHDAALGADYNWALVVDWDKVAADSDLVATHVVHLTLS